MARQSSKWTERVRDEMSSVQVLPCVCLVGNLVQEVGMAVLSGVNTDCFVNRALRLHFRHLFTSTTCPFLSSHNLSWLKISWAIILRIKYRVFPPSTAIQNNHDVVPHSNPWWGHSRYLMRLSTPERLKASPVKDTYHRHEAF